MLDLDVSQIVGADRIWTQRFKELAKGDFASDQIKEQVFSNSPANSTGQRPVYILFTMYDDSDEFNMLSLQLVFLLVEECQVGIHNIENHTVPGVHIYLSPSQGVVGLWKKKLNRLIRKMLVRFRWIVWKLF